MLRGNTNVVRGWEGKTNTKQKQKKKQERLKRTVSQLCNS